VSDLDAKQVVAAFDSASVLHAAGASALEGQPFRNLGNSALAGVAVRAAGPLPWSLLRGVYIRIGASEGISPRRLGDVIWPWSRSRSRSVIPRGVTRPYCLVRLTAR
jgi:hypothetical protein